MKILLLFVDMVRTDHLNIYNHHAKRTLLDGYIEALGGTLYTRCYSPSPDTPRSLACLQSGFNPYYNGCNTRIKWPKFYIKDNIPTIFDNAVNLGFEVNLCVRDNYFETGIFKYKNSEHIHVFDNIDKFITGWSKADDSLCFLGTPDNHLAVDDYGATDKALKKGDRVVGLLFNKLNNYNFFENFDYVFIFSDHGLLLEKEWRKQKDKLGLLGDGRTRLLMFSHKKGDSSITENNRLASMTDLYATIEELLGGDDFRQGYSFLKAPQRKITHVEDHDSFKVSPELIICQWRVISEDYDVSSNVFKTFEANGKNYNRVEFFNYLSEYSPTYIEYEKQLKILNLYKNLKNGNPNAYFIGEKRLNKRISFLIKAWLRVIRIFYQKLH